MAEYKVSRKNAVSLLTEIGFATASRMSTEKLAEKLKKLTSYGDGKKLKKAANKKGHSLIRAALKAKKKIVVTDMSAAAEAKRKQATADIAGAENCQKAKKDATAAKKKAKTEAVANKKKKEELKLKAQEKKAIEKQTKAKFRRASIIASVLMKTKKITFKDLCKKADTELGKCKTGSNIRETTYQATIMLDALITIGYITVDGDTITRNK